MKGLTGRPREWRTWPILMKVGPRRRRPSGASGEPVLELLRLGETTLVRELELEGDAAEDECEDKGPDPSVRTKVPTDLRRSKLRGGSHDRLLLLLLLLLLLPGFFLSRGAGAATAAAGGLREAIGAAPPPQAPPPGWKSIDLHSILRSARRWGQKGGIQTRCTRARECEGCACALTLERALGRDRTRQ